MLPWMPRIPQIDDVFTIDPPVPCRIICADAC